MLIRTRFYKGLRLGLAGISSCISVFLITNLTLAQQSNITPDNTLGGENSRVNSNVDINGISADKIDGGARRNSNLFHSFSEFNINNGQAVYFANPDGVENILTRVTGGNPSSILGTLGVDGAANLFLINPNGIVFGENASLDLQGSFVGTTASGLQFGEQGNFSATNAEIPGSLTVNPSALFFNQVEASGGIINKSQAPAGLTVPNGKSLLLVGGDINLDGGSLTALEGNIELASLVLPGKVGLKISGDTFSLNIPEDLERGDISLTNQSFISVFGAGGGNFTINARNLEISNSFILAGISFNLDNPNAQAGDVNLNATGLIELKDGAVIANNVDSQGNAGDINIKGDSIAVTNGSQIITDTFGFGNAGNITLNAADNITFDNLSKITSDVASNAVGKGGDIQITTGTLNVSNSAQISTTTSGQGDGGNITINAREKVIFSDLGSADSNSFDNAVGNGGDIRINTGELLLKNGGSLSSANSGAGNAGNIFLDVRETITIDSAASNSSSSRIGTFASNNNAGNIDIKTGSLFLTNGGQIDAGALGQENADNLTNAGKITINAADTVKIDGALTGLFTELSSGKGKGGDIEIKTNSLSVTNGALLFSLTDGRGNAGNITINASDTVTFDKLGVAFTLVNTNAIGDGGNIQITTGSLFVNDNSQINSGIFGKGDAGKIEINARNLISLSNFGSILSSVNQGGEGKGGQIKLIASSLDLNNGSQISANTLGKGDAGKIEINASDKITIQVTDSNEDSSGVFSAVASNGEGNGGEIKVTTSSLFLDNGGLFSTVTNGKGDAGKIEINATDLISLSNSGSILSSVNQGAEGKGGEIKLSASNVDLNNNSRITASTLGKGDAGKIELNATDSISLFNSSFIDSNIRAGAEGKGGSIDINTQTLRLTDGSQINSAVFGAEGNFPGGKGKGGEININASESVTLSGIGSTGFSSGIFTSTAIGASGDAGNITVTTDNFGIKDSAIVNATTSNEGNAGNITFNTNTFAATNGGVVATATDSSGNAGTIKLFVKDKIVLTGSELLTGLFASTSANSTGEGGSIFIDPRLVIIENGARVSVDSNGSKDGGDISLQAGTLQLNNGFITAETASTQGGNINLQISDLLLLRNESQITTTAGTAQAGGDGGNITINSKFIVAPQNENSDITANAFSGNGGTVNINSSGIFGIETQESLTIKSDITASSEEAIAGETNINTDDTSSIQNSFTELSPNIDTDAIIASSCIARGNKRQENTFRNTGSGALPTNRAGNIFVSKYATGKVRTVESNNPTWKKGDAIVEPQGLYRLKNGELLLSRECTN
ncbi:filamentous hemagglutinin family N-terminal domain protein [Rivularia sp. PCC 7116]|uniref:beta strand repeat-containing protein n=1 Tax=Rivularia sp. PCC 7116 TaxID=373994 RepID=UPI00029EF011|nr:filamentous hemagglutinin N-terminal domain-containing protein [Rivularia sp. PCC 7116]AFY55538.1 filamentous hemagglutinin family N-terminal domain protein [Rivularia sp. PCC 7116]